MLTSVLGLPPESQSDIGLIISTFERPKIETIPTVLYPSRFHLEKRFALSQTIRRFCLRRSPSSHVTIGHLVIVSSGRGAALGKMAATMMSDIPRDGRVHNPRHLSLPLGNNLHFNDPKETAETPDLSTSSSGPPPNPPFVFPATGTMSASRPLTSRAAGRRPRSAVDLPGQTFGASKSTDFRLQSSPALPDFSFNPGTKISSNKLSPTVDDFLSPPRSPQSPRASPAKPGHGHRRGGSEFVGGEYRSGSARVEMLGSSPTRSDGGLPSQNPAPADRRSRGPAHRHAHRRSAAMSSHDLSSLIGITLPKGPMEACRGSSAPSSPSGPELNKHFSFPMLRADEKRQEAAAAAQILEEQTLIAGPELTPLPTPASIESEPMPRKSFSKARVGFSDTLEFIPRPLSLVSSDASSTATVRPGHSVSGSISSIISASNSVIMEESFSVMESAPSQTGPDSRPSTAGAVLDRMQNYQDEHTDEPTSPRRRGSMPLLTDIPLPSAGPNGPSDPSPTKSTKKWSFFGLEHLSGSYSPSKSRPSSLISCEVPRDSPKLEPTPTDSAKDLVVECPLERPVKKASKKQKNVKTWAGSILTKRPKVRRGKGKKAVRRGPTPPPSRPTDEDDEDAASDTKSEPSMPTVMITELDDQDQGDAWKPPRPVTDDDTSFPMIDLDAALGPFNTPLPRNAEWEAAQKAGGLVKRQLHSAAGMSRFSGPGMHYAHHQRAQSSPEMPPFEFRRGMNRFGSSSTMADVFEEEEEDDSEKSGSSTPQAESTGPRDSEASSLSGYFPTRASVEDMTDDDATPVATRKISDPEDCRSQGAASMKSRASWSSLQEQVIEEEETVGVTTPSFRAVEFGRPTQQRLSVHESPMSSPVSPRVPLESSSSQTTASSLAPISPYSTTASSFPSPRSPALCDGTIISTAPSSVTDDSFQSLLMGEPGPEVRKSMDVPSVSSSHSSLPRENFFAQHAAQMTRAPAPGERPASFSALAFGSRRGSLASLSRLISSSHGERSKLSLEVTYNESSKKSKGSKSKRRLSKMVQQFWKPKGDSKA